LRTVGNVPEQNNTPTAADVGLSRKVIHEAREIRDAEATDPGIVRRYCVQASIYRERANSSMMAGGPNIATPRNIRHSG
jgi:hypothetical protein